MSLIAILTVSFTAQASTAVENDADVITAVEDGSFSIDATDVAIKVSLDYVFVELPIEGGVFNIAELSVSSEDLGGSSIHKVPIDKGGNYTLILAITNSTNFGVPDKPIPLTVAGDTISEKNESNKCNDSIDTWFGTHTGKLNNRTNIS